MPTAAVSFFLFLAFLSDCTGPNPTFVCFCLLFSYGMTEHNFSAEDLCVKGVAHV